MSRSRKKVPCWMLKTKGMKKFANKTIRHTWDIPDGMSYKKLFCSYSICDYKCIYWNKDEIYDEDSWYGKYPWRAWMK